MRGVRFVKGMFVLAALFAAATLVAAKVFVDHDPRVNFSSYKTYAWIAGTPSPNPAGEGMVRSALDGALQGHGLKRVDRSPDLFVASHVTRSDQQNIVVQSYGDRGYQSNWGMSENGEQNIPVGTLIVDLVDAQSKQLVWRGTGTATLSSKMSRNEKKLNKVLAKMFREFPPRGR
jgi:hypothetical protein